MSLALSKRLLARDPALISEAEFSGLVVDVARLGGWTMRYHTFSSKRSNHGFPDWVLVKGERLLFVELKAARGKVRPEQQEWLDALAFVGVRVDEVVQMLEEAGAYFVGEYPSVEAVVWRPSDWPEVVETLTGRKPSERAAA